MTDAPEAVTHLEGAIVAAIEPVDEAEASAAPAEVQMRARHPARDGGLASRATRTELIRQATKAANAKKQAHEP